MIVLLVVLLLVFASFFLIVLRGAPFVPTRSADIEKLFEIHDFTSSDMLVDLGSGDGRVLMAAAKHDVRSVGYELNPFLAALSTWRVRGLSPKPKIKAEDFWLSKLPNDTTVVFVFLAGPFTHRLDRKLEREAARLGHDIVLVSYGMKVASRKLEKASEAFMIYRYKSV